MHTDQEKRAARLREARRRAGFQNAADAAERFGWPVIAYRSHENGIRGLKAHVAKKYAKAYKCSFPWLMTGEGLIDGSSIDSDLAELPADIAEPLIKTLRQTIKAFKTRAKV